MTDYITAKEAAERWGLSERRVTTLCREERIYGSKKQGRSWMIPKEAEKPSDNRVKSGNYIQKSTEKLSMPVGISDYRVASTKYYYVDKTMLIKEFLDERPMVSLFTRPRRFGKTLNMDMLRVFFEKTEEDTSIYFRNKKIWACGERYQAYQGKYPVIFLTFKDVKCTNWEDTKTDLMNIIQAEYKRHQKVLETCDQYDKKYYQKILNKEADDADWVRSLLNLSRILHEYHKIAPIIIIDEYDTPIQQGYTKGFYDEVVMFMRNFFSGGLKDNRHLSYGFMTGILRVAKESIFSGLNNLKLNSILDERYGQYFGFTPDEVKEMAKYYGVPEKYKEIYEWYDGYRFGGYEIFNPWSVISYFNNRCKPKAFWQFTGSNDILEDILENAPEDVYEKLNKLMQGESILSYIDTAVIYPQIKDNPSTIYSFLLVTGYLKAGFVDSSYGEDYMCRVSLPNKEISFVYSKEVLARFRDVVPQSSAINIKQALYENNVTEFQKHLQKLLEQSVSFYDTAKETFYHGLVLGLCATLDNQYLITSNRESGDGRYDLQLMPKKATLPGILIELKVGKEYPVSDLKELAETAIRQIEEKHYESELRAKGVDTIVKYGVAFCGKNVEVIIK